MYRVPVERVGMKSLHGHRAHQAGRLSDLLDGLNCRDWDWMVNADWCRFVMYDCDFFDSNAPG